MEETWSAELTDLVRVAEAVAADALLGKAAETDEKAEWPAHAFEAYKAAGLMGLQVSKPLGGHGQGLLGLALVTETLALGCPSSAICFGMHCVGTAVIAAKATRDQEDRYLRPIAEGKHVTTLALSESGTGSHIYLPQTKLTRDGSDLVVDGTKQFVTNGGHADSYVVSTVASEPSADSGEFSCLIVDRKTANLTWLEPWHGFGMRGNSSRGLKLAGARVKDKNLLGAEGDQTWYVFEVVAPYFLMAMAGTYLGVAQAAFDVTVQHLRARSYEHSGETLAQVPIVQHGVAELWIMIERTRRLIRHAAQLGDLGSPRALPALLACKADASETAVAVTNQAMTLCGGIAYRENGTLTRLLRDARASHVMSPTSDMLKQWAGRTLLGQPLL